MNLKCKPKAHVVNTFLAMVTILKAVASEKVRSGWHKYVTRNKPLKVPGDLVLGCSLCFLVHHHINTPRYTPTTINSMMV